MLGEVFERFVEKSPISIMVRASLVSVYSDLKNYLGCCGLPSVQKRYRIRPDFPTCETPGEEIEVYQS
jgi:hypothetical protein